MSAPTIQSLNPSKGPTGGLTLVEVLGAGFRVSPTEAPSVEVLVGTRPAQSIYVRSESSLAFITPASTPGLADIVIRNLDDSGHPIPGEEIVLAKTFSYELTPLAQESDLTRLVRTLLKELKRQVLPNISLTVQTDFDSETGSELHQTEVASLPALVLSGPELAEDRFYSFNEIPEQDIGPSEFVRRRVPYTVDLTFTLIGVADHTVELLNLMAMAQLFFHRNKYLEMDRDPSNSSRGQVRYEMDIAQGGGLKIASQPNESNVRSFTGSFVIRGFDFEELTGFTGESIIERGIKASDVHLPSPTTFSNP